MILDIEDSIDVNGKFIDQQPAYDKITNFKVALQLDEEIFAGRVKQKSLGPESKIVGRYDANPMLNYMIC